MIPREIEKKLLEAKTFDELIITMNEHKIAFSKELGDKVWDHIDWINENDDSEDPDIMSEIGYDEFH